MPSDVLPFVDATASVARIKAQPGLIPIGFDGHLNQITWADLGTYHPYEGRFRDTLAAAQSLAARVSVASNVSAFRSPADILDNLLLDPQTLVAPTAFIFGTSRCGSTLVTRALARCRSNLVYGEPALPDQAFRQFGDCLPPRSAQTLLRWLGRRRLAAHRSYFVKFSSITTHALSRVREAFPDVPCLFLYRDPLEVLVSLSTTPPAWFNLRATPAQNDLVAASGPAQSDVEFYAQVVRRTYQVALAQRGPKWSMLNYANLTPSTLRDFLENSGCSYSEKDHAAMARVFASDAKVPFKNLAFHCDRGSKAARASDQVAASADALLTDVYHAALTSPFNLASKHTSVA